MMMARVVFIEAAKLATLLTDDVVDDDDDDDDDSASSIGHISEIATMINTMISHSSTACT